MRSKLAALFALALLAIPALAQVPKSTLISNTSTSFPDQTTGAITPATTRAYFQGLINSFQQYTGVNPQAGATYTIQTTDYGQLVSFTNGTVAVTLPQATGNFQTFNFYARNDAASGTVTITPQAGSTLCDTSSLALTSGGNVWIVSDGTNWRCQFFGTGVTSPITYPLSVNFGGTGGSVPSGTLLDNITQFASNGFVVRSGAGTYTFVSTSNGISPNAIQQVISQTVLANVSSNTASLAAVQGGQLSPILCQPQISVLISGANATFTTPTCNGALPQRLDLTMIGAGGGGSGSGTAAGGATTSGTDTCWKASGTACTSPLFAAGGGTGASLAGTAAIVAGGAPTNCDVGINGGAGSGSTTATSLNIPGADGAVSALGGGGAGAGSATVAGGNAAANSGSGGGGGGGGGATPLLRGAAGAAGAYCYKMIALPLSSYVYTIGTKGNAGTAGASGGAGGNGADGVIRAISRWQ